MNEQSNTLRFDSINSVLSFAISKEEEAHHFYNQWAEKVQNQSIKEVLYEFAKEELKHKELLLQVQRGEPFEKTSPKIVDLKIGDYFTTVSPTEEMTYQDALQIAIQREIGAKQLYEFLASLETTDDLKALFRRLAAEEAKHKMKLETIYDDEIYTEN